MNFRYLAHDSPMPAAARLIFTIFAMFLSAAIVVGCAKPAGVYTWGATDYESAAKQLRTQAEAEMAKPCDRRSKDAGILLLDYAASCLSAGEVDSAQRAFYEAILLTNDLTLNESSGRASLVFSESMKTWQGEAYERAMIELLHGICLMQLNDFDNARVAFDRALVSDRISKGALAEIEGQFGSNGLFELNAECIAKGGSIFQRDFLAAHLLRTVCYLKSGRNKLAIDSWNQAVRTYQETRLVFLRSKEIKTPLAWTDYDGRYANPNVYVPPVGNVLSEVNDDIFSASIDEIRQSNLLIITATGNRPKKIKVGQANGNDTNFIHDSYYAPIQATRRVGLMVDGKFAGFMTQCLDLYGQSAGRGPSIKDLAQKRKGEVEDFARSLQRSDNNYIKLIGLIVRAANQEESDTRQWSLLPNAIHVWMKRIEPGRHRIVLLPCGENIPSRDYYFIDRAFAHVMQQTELNYVQSLALPPPQLLAPRHVRTVDIEVDDSGLAIVFVPEAFNLEAEFAPVLEPKRYELLPRRIPPKP